MKELPQRQVEPLFTLTWGLDILQRIMLGQSWKQDLYQLMIHGELDTTTDFVYAFSKNETLLEMTTEQLRQVEGLRVYYYQIMTSD